MQMTPFEKRMFKEAVIREYKLKNGRTRKRDFIYDNFAKLLRRAIPLNITVGVIASGVLIYLKGWNNFFLLLLTGIIWITLISTLVSTFVKPR